MRSFCYLGFSGGGGGGGKERLERWGLGVGGLFCSLMILTAPLFSLYRLAHVRKRGIWD